MVMIMVEENYMESEVREISMGKAHGVLFTITSAVLFGFNPLISKSIDALGGNSMMTSWGRLLVTGIGMGMLYYVLTGKTLSVSRRVFFKLLICAQGYSFTPVLLYSSYNYIDSGLATTIHFTYPTLVLIGCKIFLKRKMDWAKKIGCILCLAGILFLGRSNAKISGEGFLLAFISAIAFASYIVYLDGSGLEEMHPVKMASWLSFIGAVEMLPILFLMHKVDWAVTPSKVGLVVLFGIISGCMASTFFQIGTKLIGAASASMLSTFEPITSIIVGAIVYHEKLTVFSVGGIICILSAVIIVARTELTRSRITNT